MEWHSGRMEDAGRMGGEGATEWHSGGVEACAPADGIALSNTAGIRRPPGSLAAPAHLHKAAVLGALHQGVRRVVGAAPEERGGEVGQWLWVGE